MTKDTAMKRKPSRQKLRPHIDRLYKAVAHYVKKEGGKVVVIGGIQTIKWPTDLTFNYTIGIKCTGLMPVYGTPPTRKTK